jgi:hypothetical protein
MLTDIYRGFCSETRIQEETFEAKTKGIREFQIGSKYRRRDYVARDVSVANSRAIRHGFAVPPATARARLRPYHACLLKPRVSAVLGCVG